MEVVALFSPEVTEALRSKTPTSAATDVLNTLRETGVSLELLDPGAEDPTLNRYFVIRVSDQARAEEVASRLRSLNVTEAAYVKPPGEAP
jgi:hypothetical protein